MDLRISTRLVAGHHVLGLDGVVDLAAIPRLHGALGQLLAQSGPDPLAVDLDGVTVLDDAALGLLLGAAATARSSGRILHVVCGDDRLRRRLADARFDRAVPVNRSLAEAIAAANNDVP